MSDDRAAVLELLYRYAELVDSGDFVAVGRLLDRAEFGGVGTATVSGAANIAGLFAMTTRRFEAGTPMTRHLVLNPIVQIDGDTASARSTFCVVQATDLVPLQPVVVGRYLDRFARAGGWHFTRRITDVEMVGNTADHLLIDPRRFGH
ncbi:MAG: nuclear transport factor 2 family protein [Actinomycetia bacterium]|nr:nuclear transport factor 2 family protein [Actinomycetes bacterium]